MNVPNFSAIFSSLAEVELTNSGRRHKRVEREDERECAGRSFSAHSTHMSND